MSEGRITISAFCLFWGSRHNNYVVGLSPPPSIHMCNIFILVAYIHV